VRVIAGQLRGRRLHSARVAELRPTSDRVREAIFNILGDGVKGARVLDLYAGTGALAIEALSRGAARATCVERDPQARAALERNVAALDLDERLEIVALDALDYCRQIAEDGATYEMVFCDPPYATDLEPLVDAVVEQDWWTSVCVIEHAANGSVGESATTADTRRYGDTGVTFFWRQ
jgi:16S rRNA (guanine(966)-N(2))-methyltransferase RsmD